MNKCNKEKINNENACNHLKKDYEFEKGKLKMLIGCGNVDDPKKSSKYNVAFNRDKNTIFNKYEHETISEMEDRYIETHGESYHPVFQADFNHYLTGNDLLQSIVGNLRGKFSKIVFDRETFKFFNFDDQESKPLLFLSSLLKKSGVLHVSYNTLSCKFDAENVKKEFKNSGFKLNKHVERSRSKPTSYTTHFFIFEKQ